MSGRRKTLFDHLFTKAFCAGVVLFLCVATTAEEGSCSVTSIRTGIQPKGPRIVLDLDRPAKYSIDRTGGDVLVRVSTDISRAMQGGFPSNRLASSFRADSEGDGVSVVKIALASDKVSIKHFVLKNPDRIVIDLYPSSAAAVPPPAPKTPETGGTKPKEPEPSPVNVASQNLVPASGTYGGKGPQAFNGLLTDVDLSVNSIFATQTFYVDISPTWKVLDGCYIHVVLSHSQMTNPRISNVVVSVNDAPVQTIILDKSNTWKGEIKIPVGAEYFGPETNEITLSSFMRASEEQCQDIDNPGNWLRIHRESFVHLRYMPRSDLRLMDFTTPYFETNPYHKENCLLVVPDKFQPEELQAAYSLVLDWARKARFKDFRPLVMRLGDVTPELATAFNIIYFGRSAAFPASLHKSFGTPDHLKDVAFMSTFLNDKGRGRMLVTAENAAGVLFGTRALMLPELKDQMNNRKLALSLKTPLPSADTKAEEEMDLLFSEVFTGDVVFRGTYSHEQMLSFQIPPQWELRGDPQLVLHFRHAPALNERKSALTVEMDDVPVRSSPLGPSNIENGRLVVPIPENKRGGEFLNINLTAYLDIDTFDCGHNFTEAAWLVVDRASYLHMPHDIKTMQPLLEYLPYAFTGNVITLYVSPSADGDALTAMGDVLLDWQQNLLSGISLKVQSLNAFKAPAAGQSAVVLAPVDQILAKNIKLAVGYDNKQKRIISGSSVPVVPDFGEDAALFQLVRGGETDGGLILAAGWARNMPNGELFSDVLLKSRLMGDLCLVSPKGKIVPFYLETPEPRAPEKAPETWYERLLERFRGDRTILGVFALSTSLVLFVLFVSLIRTMRRR